jgi:hypothetical protein
MSEKFRPKVVAGIAVTLSTLSLGALKVLNADEWLRRAAGRPYDRNILDLTGKEIEKREGHNPNNDNPEHFDDDDDFGSTGGTGSFNPLVIDGGKSLDNPEFLGLDMTEWIIALAISGGLLYTIKKLSSGGIKTQIQY